MPHRLSATGLALLAAACSPQPPPAEVCPPAPVAVECPGFPARGSTLRELLRAWEQARAVHAECHAALGAWEIAHRNCRAP